MTDLSDLSDLSHLSGLCAGSDYPSQLDQRNQWIVDQRPARASLDPSRPYAFLVEEECSAEREVVSVATIFLTNRECPWRCVMCDLWRNTLTTSVPIGAIPAQIDYALERLPQAAEVKLYNSGSFFDRQAIPQEDHIRIAARINHFKRVIVECHPTLVSQSCLSFHDLLTGQLEVAMGLETAHPEVLERLNKRMTLHDFSRAADFLRCNQIDLRVFILVQPPFMSPEESLPWAQQSLDFAFDCGATVASLIPTRGGNGAMESIALQGSFIPPSLVTLEAALDYGLSLQRGRVLADLWDLRNHPPRCRHCWPQRLSRIHQINLHQQPLAPITCSLCGGLS